MSKQLKELLKLSKDHIDKKEYLEAIGYIQQVVNYEEHNYVALMFAGFCYEKLKQAADAEQMYTRAVQVDPKNVQAWLGFAELYEKHASVLQDVVAKKINVYEKVMLLDKTKWAIFAEKLVWILQDANKRLDILEKLEPSKNTSLLVLYVNTLLQVEEMQMDKLVQTKMDAKMEELRQAFEKKMLKKANYSKTELQKMMPPDSELLKASEAEELRAQYLKEVTSEHLKNNATTKWDTMAEHVIKTEKQIPFEIHNKFIERLLARFVLTSDEKLKLRAIEESKSMLQFHKQAWLPLETTLLHAEEDDGAYEIKYKSNLVTKLVHSYPFEGLGMIYLAEMFIKAQVQSFDDINLMLHKGLEAAPQCITGWILQTRLVFQQEKYLKAVECAQNGLKHAQARMDQKAKLEKVCTELRQLLGRAFIFSNQLDKAEAEFKGLLQKDKKNVEALFGLGEVSFAKQDYETSRKLNLLVLQNDAKHNQAHAQLGWIYFLSKKYKEAEKELLDAISLNGADYLHHFRLARVYWDMGETEVKYRKEKPYVYTRLMKSAQLNPNNASTFTYLGYYYERVENDVERAIKCYRKAVTLNPMEQDAGETLGNIYNQRGQTILASELYRDATSKNSRAKWAWRRLAFYNQYIGEYDESLLCFQHALRIDNVDPKIWEGLAETYEKQGKYLAALKAFTKAVELDPKLVYSAAQIASIRQALGEMNESHKQFEKVIETNPDYIVGYRGLADVLFEIGKSHAKDGVFTLAVYNFLKAQHAILMALAKRPELHSFWKLLGDVQSYFFHVPEHAIKTGIEKFKSKTKKLPIIYTQHVVFKQSRAEYLKEGANSYQKSIDIIGDEADLYFDLGVNLYLQYQLQKTDQRINSQSGLVVQDAEVAQSVKYQEQAVQSFKQALSLNPNVSKFWNGFGAAESKVELRQHAFIRSIQCDSKNYRAWNNLGMLYVEYGDYDLAQEAFVHAQNLDPTNITSWIGLGIINETVVKREGIKKAKANYRHATTLESSAPAYLSCAYTALVLGDTLDAFQCIMKYLQFNENDPLAWNILGLIFESQLKFGESEHACKTCVQILELYNQSESVETQFTGLITDTETFSMKPVPCSVKDMLRLARINYARLLQIQHKNEEALKIYSQIDESKDDGVKLGICLCLYEMGKQEEALKRIKPLTTSKTPLREQTILLYGKLLYQSNKKTEAKAAFETCLKDFPQSEEAHKAYAVYLAMTGTSATASLQVLRQLRQFQLNGDTSTYKIESHIHAHFGDFSKARNAVCKAIYLHPYQAYLWDDLASLMLRYPAMIGYDKSNLLINPQVLSYLTSNMLDSSNARFAVQKFDNQVHHFVNRLYHIAGLYYLMGSAPGFHNAQTSLQHALKMVQRALHHDPTHKEAHQLLASITHSLALLKREKTWHETAVTMLSQFDTVPMQAALSEQYLFLEQAQKAVECLKSESNTYLQALSHIAQAKALRMQNATMDKILACFEQAMTKDAACHTFAWCTLADMFIQDSKLKAAEQCLKHVPQSFGILVKLALVYYQSKNTKEGLATITKALQINDSSPVAHLLAGKLYYQANDLANSEASIKKSLRFDASQPISHLSLYHIHYKQESWEAAENDLWNERDRNPSHSTMYYLLATFAMESQAYEAAFRTIQKAIHLNPTRKDYWQSLTAMQKAYNENHVEVVQEAPKKQQDKKQQQPQQQQPQKKKK